jgi:hypothetical protein
MVKETNKQVTNREERWIETTDVAQKIHHWVYTALIRRVFRIIPDENSGYVTIWSSIGGVVGVKILDLHKLQLRLLT